MVPKLYLMQWWIKKRKARAKIYVKIRLLLLHESIYKQQLQKPQLLCPAASYQTEWWRARGILGQRHYKGVEAQIVDSSEQILKILEKNNKEFEEFGRFRGWTLYTIQKHFNFILEEVGSSIGYKNFKQENDMLRFAFKNYQARTEMRQIHLDSARKLL